MTLSQLCIDPFFMDRSGFGLIHFSTVRESSNPYAWRTFEHDMFDIGIQNDRRTDRINLFYNEKNVL